MLVLQGGVEVMPDWLKDFGCLPLVDRATGLGLPRQEWLPLVLLALAVAAVATNLVPVAAAFLGSQ